MKILLTLGAPDSFGIGLRPARRATLNIATGEVYSFRDIPERVAAAAKPVVAVRGTPRQGEMPHGGYRPFDIAACRRAFPDFRYTSLADGLNRAGGGQGRA